MTHPYSVNPVFYKQHGITLFKENDIDGAESVFAGALHLAQDNPPPDNAPALIADIYWNRRDVVTSFLAEISKRYQPRQE